MGVFEHDIMRNKQCLLIRDGQETQNLLLAKMTIILKNL